MKANLIVNSSSKSALTNISVQSETELADSDKNLTINTKITKNKKKGNLTAKQLQKTGAFMQKPKFNDTKKKTRWEK